MLFFSLTGVFNFKPLLDLISSVLLLYDFFSSFFLSTSIHRTICLNFTLLPTSILPQDVRELIPEFFCLPDFLMNKNNFDFGITQKGEEVILHGNFLDTENHGNI